MVDAQWWGISRASKEGAKWTTEAGGKELVRQGKGFAKADSLSESMKEPSGPTVRALPGEEYSYEQPEVTEEDWQRIMREAQEARFAAGNSQFGQARETDRSRERRTYLERTNGFRR